MIGEEDERRTLRDETAKNLLALDQPELSEVPILEGKHAEDDEGWIVASEHQLGTSACRSRGLCDLIDR